MNSNALDVLVDIGGTSVRVGVARLGSAGPVNTFETPKRPADLLSTLVATVRSLEKRYRRRLRSVRIGCPGLVDRDGLVQSALYLPLTGYDLQEKVRARTNVDVIVLNDAAAQAIGCRHGDESLFYIVLGTGVGGAQIDRGKLVTGSHGFAGEVGHIRTGNSAARCLCGQAGCLDLSASGYWLERQLGQHWWKLPLRRRERYRLVKAGYHVARAATTIVSLLDSDRIVIAGHLTAYRSFREGIAKAWGSPIADRCAIEFVRHTWPLASKGLGAAIELLER